MGEYNSTAKERRLTMPKKVVLEFPVALSKGIVISENILKKAEEACVLELLRKMRLYSFLI